MWARHNFDKYVRVLLKQWPIFGSLITWDVNERSIRLNEIYHAVIYKVKCYRMLAFLYAGLLARCQKPVYNLTKLYFLTSFS